MAVGSNLLVGNFWACVIIFERPLILFIDRWENVGILYPFQKNIAYIPLFANCFRECDKFGNLVVSDPTSCLLDKKSSSAIPLPTLTIFLEIRYKFELCIGRYGVGILFAVLVMTTTTKHGHIGILVKEIEKCY